MSVTPADPDALRVSARTIQRLAMSLGGCQALELHRRAGTEVWRGPLASACRDDLVMIRRRLLAAQDELLHAARRLSRLAAEADTLARR